MHYSPGTCSTEGCLELSPPPRLAIDSASSRRVVRDRMQRSQARHSRMQASSRLLCAAPSSRTRKLSAFFSFFALSTGFELAAFFPLLLVLELAVFFPSLLELELAAFFPLLRRFDSPAVSMALTLSTRSFATLRLKG